MAKSSSFPSPSSFRLSGILLMCQASLAFSVMVVGVRLATASLPALEVVFFRSFLGSLLIGFLMIQKKISFLGKPEERKFLVLRGIAGFIALSLHFYTISVLPLGTAVILNFTGPIFVALLATLFLRERPGAFLVLMILVAFLGVALLVRPEFRVNPAPQEATVVQLWCGVNPSQGVAVFLALLSGLFAAVAVLAIRAVRERESPLTLIFYFTAISTLGSFFYLPFGFQWPGWKEWLAILLVVAGSFYGQLWMTIAYRRAPASLVSPFSYLTPLACFFYGLFFWNERLSLLNFLGVVFLTLAGVLISILESRRVRKPLIA